MECQEIRRLRRELQSKCLLRIKIDDTGDYIDILGTLRRLKDEVKPNKRPQWVRRYARDMESLLQGMYDRLEAHAMAKRPGLAKILYSEVSGQAEIPSLKRIDKACREYEAMEKKSPTVGGGSSSFKGSYQKSFNRSPGTGFSGYKSSRGGRAHQPDKKSDLSHVECYGCKRFGHYRHQCPDADKVAK